MKKGIKWGIGIFLGLLIAYAAWNIFTNHTFFLGETTRVNGKIIEVFPSREVNTYRRRVKFVYAVEDKYYHDFYNLGTQDAKQAIGNSVQISYSNKYPQFNIVEKLLSEHRNTNEARFYSNLETGYIDLRLVNGIYKFKEYAGQGKLVCSIVGEYEMEKDTLHFTPYVFGADTIMDDNLNKLVFDSKIINQLNDTDNDRIYKRIKAKK